MIIIRGIFQPFSVTNVNNINNQRNEQTEKLKKREFKIQRKNLYGLTFRYVWAIKEGIIKTVLKKRKKWSAATCSAQFAGSRNKIMVIYAAIFPTDRGIWRAATRPACTWLPAQRTPQFTWKRFPVDILFFAAFIFDVPFFILPVVRPLFSRHGPLSPSNSCTSSFSLPHPLQPPDSPLILRPGFFPHSIHTRAFTFDESRWNYPLHSRGQWSSFCEVKR